MNLPAIKSTTLKRLIIIFGLVLLALAYNLLSKKNTNSAIDATPPPIIDEYMTGGTTYRFNEKGEKIQQLVIGKLWHREGEHITHIEQPSLTLYENGQVSWNIQSDLGESLHSDMEHRLDHINLKQHVILVKFENNSTPSWSLVTDFLTIHPLKKTAYTNSAVALTSPQMNLTAIGLTGDFNQNKIEFLENINAHYTTPGSKNLS